MDRDKYVPLIKRIWHIYFNTAPGTAKALYWINHSNKLDQLCTRMGYSVS